jgi:hypothetical protein
VLAVVVVRPLPTLLDRLELVVLVAVVRVLLPQARQPLEQLTLAVAVVVVILLAVLVLVVQVL